MMNSQHLSESQGNPIPGSYSSLHDLLVEAGRQNASDTAVVCLHQTGDRYPIVSAGQSSPYLRWTFADLSWASHALAESMVEAGIRPGMRIVAFLPNCIEFHIAFRAALELNCTFAPINPRSVGSAEEVQNIYDVVKPAIVLAEDLVLASKLEKLAPDSTDKLHLRLVANPGDEIELLRGWQSMAAFMKPSESGNGFHDLKVTRDENDVVLIFMTSGTTSLPKGCPHTNRSITTSIRAFLMAACYDKSRSVCGHLPSSHMFGFLLVSGAAVSGIRVVHPSSWYDADSTLRALREERCSDMAGVPAMMTGLLMHPQFAKKDTSCLKLVLLGAAAVSIENLKSIINDLGASKAADAYGMSEGAPITINSYDDMEEYKIPESVASGSAAPGLKLRVCDPETGKIVPRLQPGELQVSGDAVIREYWRAEPKKDDDTFVNDDQGYWFRTGDQVVMLDDGQIRIVGRYKDLIIRGGENISPRAIEDLLSRRFNLLAEVCGVPDEIAGEVPVAVIKRKQGQDAPESMIKQALVAELGPSFALEGVIDIETLGLQDFPRSAGAGKVQKNILRQKVKVYLEAQSTRTVSATQVNGEHSHEELTQILVRLWTKMLGAAEGSITAETSMHEWADSLTMGRFPTFLQRETGKVARLQDLLTHPTPAEQAKFLKSTSGSAQVASLQPIPSHKGPPSMEDMVHIHDDESRFEKTVQICKSTLEPLGMDWEDVQDVLPMYSYQQRFLIPRRRLRTFNHRHTYACPGISVKTARAAVEAALSHHDILRTMAVMFDDQTALHVVMRPGEKWSGNCITVLDQSVGTAADLETLFFDDTKYDYAAFPGPLFRVLIVHVKDEDCAGIMYFGNHSTFDAISLTSFIEDLDLLLVNPKEQRLSATTQFKAYVYSAYNLRTSRPARTSITWHVKRLAGLKEKKSALFPIQRAPEWFKGDYAGWIDPSTGKPGRREARGGLNTWGVGARGISARCDLSGMQHLKKDYGIETPCILKAALAILNSRKTGQRTALFSQSQAARNWPFIADWQETLMPPAMAVDGPTVEVVVLRVDLESPQTTVLQLMQGFQDEQILLNKHHHAPFDDIASALGPEDGEIFSDLSRRQIFNWLPLLSGSPLKRLRKIQLLSRADVGLQWNCAQSENESVIVMPSWDDAQLTLEEVQDLVNEMIDIAEVLVKENNWDTKVHNVISTRPVNALALNGVKGEIVKRTITRSLIMTS